MISRPVARAARARPRSVARGSPQATICSSTKPTASPGAKRPCLSSRAAGATAPVAMLVERRPQPARVLLERRASGSCSTRQASPACGQRDSTTATVLLRQLGGALGGHDHVAAVRQHDHLVGGDLVDAGEDLEGARVERRARPRRRARRAARRARACPSPAATATTPQRHRRARAAACVAREPRRALLLLLVHVGDVEPLDRRRPPSNTATARSGSSVWTCTRSVERSPTTSTESPISSSVGDVGAARRAGRVPEHDEVRAVAVSGSTRGACAVRAARRAWCATSGSSASLAAQRRRSRRRPAASRRSRRRRRRRARAAPAAARARARPTPAAASSACSSTSASSASCSSSVASRVEPRLLHVRQLGRDAVRHLAHDRDHRALGRVAHRRVGGVGGARERGRDEHRVDELAGPARQLLGGAAHDLREDHAAVAARAEQRGARDGLARSRRGRSSSTVWPLRRSSSSITARSVCTMLSPVSPSATGNTFRSLTS